MKKNRFSIYFLFLLVLAIALPVIFGGGSVALSAEGASQSAESGLDSAAAAANLTSQTDAVTLAGSIVKFVLSFLGVIFLVLMLYAGFMRMTAQGDAKKVETSTAIIRSAIIGIVIIFVSYIVTIFVIDKILQTVGTEENYNYSTEMRGGDVNSDLPNDLPVECVAGSGACSWKSCGSGSPNCVNGRCVCP